MCNPVPLLNIGRKQLLLYVFSGFLYKVFPIPFDSKVVQIDILSQHLFVLLLDLAITKILLELPKVVNVLLLRLFVLGADVRIRMVPNSIYTQFLSLPRLRFV